MTSSSRAGLASLRAAVSRALQELAAESGTPFAPAYAASAGVSTRPRPRHHDWMLTQAAPERTRDRATGGTGGDPAGGPPSDHDLATSSVADEVEGRRLIALVELARGGDKEAFGLLYDHYHGSVYRFLYYRLGSVPLAEDLTAETFFRALRSMNNFRWQGRDFGAWLMTIARNLTVDHYKAGRTRLEQTTEDMGTLDSTTEGPELQVLAQLTNDALLEALHSLPQDQQDCLVMRFLQGMSLAETAEALDRTSGAVKQLQLRAVRHLASLLPEGIR